MADDPGFDEFYAATTHALVAQVYAMVGDLGEAEDAVAEAYARAWRRWPQLRGYADPSAWVRTVAYRIAVSSWRRARNRAFAHRQVGPGTDSGAVLNPETVVLIDALRQIPPNQRRAVVLYHLVGMPVAEIATEMGASTSAVKQWLSRGRRSLQSVIGEETAEVNRA
jgi:RNA polymerase sigma-70 factor, ECF subfamily